MKLPSKRQNEVLQAIAKSWSEGRPPTTGELLETLNLATESGLTNLLKPLTRDGYLSIRDGVRGRQRFIELTQLGWEQSGMGFPKFPVLGEIPAGPLQEAIQQSSEWINGFDELLDARNGDFLLRVKGDSMIGAGILPGDYVQMRPGIAVRSGEIVAAQISNEGDGSVEATLKFLDYVEGQRTVRLRAANPDYPDREFNAENVSIAGVFRGLVRGYKH